MAFAKNIDVIINKMLQLQTPFYSVTEMDGKAILDENENKISGFNGHIRRAALQWGLYERTVITETVGFLILIIA